MITTFKNLQQALIGQSVPERYYGNVGIFVEDLIEAWGVKIDRTGNVPDIVDLEGKERELKTRANGATSAQTVGSMTDHDIKHTPNWKDTPLYRKFQHQVRVHYDEHTCIITDVEELDFSHPDIQKAARISYETARAEMLNSPSVPKYIRGDAYSNSVAKGYFEWKASNSWGFRFPDAVMKTFEKLAREAAHFSELFDE